MAGTRKTRNTRKHATYSKKKNSGKRAPLGEIDANGAEAEDMEGRGKTVKKSKTRNIVEDDVPKSITIPKDPPQTSPLRRSTRKRKTTSVPTASYKEVDSDEEEHEKKVLRSAPRDEEPEDEASSTRTNARPGRKFSRPEDDVQEYGDWRIMSAIDY